jgi:hypothetical protein
VEEALDEEVEELEWDPITQLSTLLEETQLEKDKLTYALQDLQRHRLTPNRSSLSSRWRGMTVTISISQRKATSEGVKPGGSGRAICRKISPDMNQ